MKLLEPLLALLFLILLTGQMEAQLTNNKPSVEEKLYGTNDQLRQSYMQQLIDFKKNETERILNEKLKTQSEAQQNEIKENREREKLARLMHEQEDLKERQQESVQQDLLRQRKEELLAKYIAKLQQNNVTRGKQQLSTNRQGASETQVNEAAPPPDTEEPSVQTNMTQEAINPDTPN